MTKLEVKFKKLEQGTLWKAGKVKSYTMRDGWEGDFYSSRTKAINHFLTEFNKLIKGKTEFTLIGICEDAIDIPNEVEVKEDVE